MQGTHAKNHHQSTLLKLQAKGDQMQRTTNFSGGVSYLATNDEGTLQFSTAPDGEGKSPDER
jgi:hypothetical protein